jgi:hypothetical protein
VEELPNAPAAFSVDGIFHECPAHTRLLRIYFRSGTHPNTWDSFRYFGPTASRFDHHNEPQRLQARGILYATAGKDAFRTALAEVFQYTRLIDLKRNEPWLAVFDLERPLKLLDTSGQWPVRAGGNMAINSGSRAKARGWSRAIYESYSDAEGVWYPSSVTNGPCVALYERARGALPLRPMFNEALDSRKVRSGVLQCAAELRFAVS